MQCAPGYFPFFGSCEPADSSLSLAEIPHALASAAVSRMPFRWLCTWSFLVGEQCYAENSMIHQFGSTILNIVPVWITWLVINRWMDFAPLQMLSCVHARESLPCCRILCDNFSTCDALLNFAQIAGSIGSIEIDWPRALSVGFPVPLSPLC